MRYLHHASFGIGVLGVLVIVFGVLSGLARFVRAEFAAARGSSVEEERRQLRPVLGYYLLLGLELLIAATNCILAGCVVRLSKPIRLRPDCAVTTMMLSTGLLPAPARLFNTTHWSVVLLAGQSQSPQSDEALEKLCRLYWPPLYGFIRRRGYSEEDGRDLTQEFFRLLLQRHDFGSVDPGKGKFRTFLLTSLSHFLSNQRDLALALKRGGGQNLISLDELDAERARVELSSSLSPDKLFDMHWAMTVLEHALAQLQQELAAAGRDAQFTELKPYLTDDPDEGDYSAAAARLGVPRQTVAVLVHRLRRRYRELVRAEVAQTVSSPLELEQEMRHLFEALAG